MKRAYPALFYKDAETGSYAVEVPDLPGCVSGGDSLDEAVFMATDAASGWVLTELEDGTSFPRASALQDIKADEPPSFVSLLTLDMDAYTEKYGNKAARKEL